MSKYTLLIFFFISKPLFFAEQYYSWDISSSSEDVNILKSLQPYSFLATDDSFRDFALYSQTIQLKIVDSNKKDPYPLLLSFNPKISCSVGGEKVKKIAQF